MIETFPMRALASLRCPADGRPLERAGSTGARCAGCGRVFPIEGPVLSVGLENLHEESEHERRIRDAEASANPEPSWNAPSDVMETDATLEALDLRAHHRLLEMGPGRGRFTRRVESLCAEVVAVDISLESLRGAARRLSRDTVALIQGDATKPVVAPGTFDRVLGTLTSNLPSRTLREASYAAASQALRADGKFVFTTHYLGIRARLDREPREGRYTEGGIYRCLLTAADVRRETAPYFRRARVRPICVVLPFSRRLGIPLAGADRIARRMPLLRAFGDLLLVEASAPRR
ncbi:MAG: class I SAM-dependent methyltransferase [Longimicrobiales bacterium]